MTPAYLLEYIREREIDPEVAEEPPRHLPGIIETFRDHATAFGRGHCSDRQPIHFSITDSSDFNAHATSHPRGGHLVALNLGLVLGLLDFTHSSLAHPEVLPAFGDPKQEIAHPFLFRTSLHQNRSKKSRAHFDLPQSMPRCPRRLQVARALYELTLSFVFLHEVSHVTNGHTQYKEELLLCPPIFRSHGAGLRLKEKEALFAQAFETDADWFASRLLVSFIPENISLFSSHQSIDFSFDERLELTCLAILMVFQYSENVGKDWTTTRRTEHPHPLVRQVSFEPVVREQLSRIEKHPEDQVVQGYMSAVKDLVRIERVLGLPRFLSTFTPEIGSEIENWLGRVIEIQRRLQSHLRGEGLDGRKFV